MSYLSRLHAALLLLAATLLIGCETTPTSHIDDMPRSARAWINSVGGVTDDAACQERADAILHRLVAPWEPPGEPVRLAIIDDDRVRAYAWPPCYVLVSRGMMNKMQETEIAAAIAHELGHLIDDRHLDPPAALVGGGHSPNQEHRADAIGLKLMARAQYNAEGMTSLLDYLLQDETLSVQTRGRIERRLEDCAD